ncbi:MAG TPA: hypothetical protein VHO90_12780 [Bacteroidales bacterium]|nr:hypothetical protein [Bacteroidales bacterium]
MLTKTIKTIAVLFLALILAWSCKKDEDDTPETKYQAPSLASHYNVIQVPEKLSSSTDQNAQMAAGYMSMANALSGYASFFEVPENATQSKLKSSATVYTWTYDGTTVKLTYNEDATKRYWTWYVNNVKFMDCQELITGNGGSFNVYDVENGGTAVIVYNWEQSATAITSAMKLIGSETYLFETTATLDGKSGKFDMYEGGTTAGLHILNVTWLSNGSGSWWISYGGETYSGNWTA